MLLNRRIKRYSCHTEIHVSLFNDSGKDFLQRCVFLGCILSVLLFWDRPLTEDPFGSLYTLAISKISEFLGLTSALISAFNALFVIRTPFSPSLHLKWDKSQQVKLSEPFDKYGDSMTSYRSPQCMLSPYA